MKWEKVKIGDVLKVKSGINLTQKDMAAEGIYPVYGGNGITGYHSNFNVVEPTIIIGRVGYYCGSVHLTTGNAWITDNAFITNFSPELFDRKYLYYALRKLNLRQYSNSSAQPVISGGGISSGEIICPPLPIQKQIANILDKSDALRKKDQQLLQKYDELAQAIFIDIFGDPVKNEKGWEVMKLGEVCVKITDGTHFSPPSQTSGIPYITAKHVKKEGIDFYSNPTFVSEQHHKEIYSRCTPKMGDVLYIKDGATTGIAAVNLYEFEFSMLSSLALIKPNLDKLNNYYLTAWLNNENVKETYIRNYMAGAAIRRFTLDKIKRFEILVPPVELQNKFELLINNMFHQKKKMSIDSSESLFHSLLQKAFRGELIT